MIIIYSVLLDSHLSKEDSFIMVVFI